MVIIKGDCISKPTYKLSVPLTKISLTMNMVEWTQLTFSIDVFRILLFTYAYIHIHIHITIDHILGYKSVSH